MEIPPTLENALTPLVMLLTCKKMPKYKKYEEIQPRTQNNTRKKKHFII